MIAGELELYFKVFVGFFSAMGAVIAFIVAILKRPIGKKFLNYIGEALADRHNSRISSLESWRGEVNDKLNQYDIWKASIDNTNIYINDKIDKNTESSKEEFSILRDELRKVDDSNRERLEVFKEHLDDKFSDYHRDFAIIKEVLLKGQNKNGKED